ncbi:hypothetical protein PACID_15710 [Acidipropionibacterium acidipropionici ATCC 4875]|uniref:Uncharacterized protein n=1 Tax=Acidipropionibacterium acidipropionici (strain ATCC 4875 / DSM 20272 / JCM 6432 / NBRC 12425 / NCIMB 8070 / 4) TaxID=1171373 RepID=K7RN68_ACIA4|nr:hypothetical protein [Acidipropionibacterium acidipropionici]AFV89384.1 hypothetical protein PACID_15710 [Acidipropionibacterium acidipropionici ATCC 4875]
MNDQIPPGILAQFDQIAADHQSMELLTGMCQAAPEVAAQEIAGFATLLTILSATGSWDGLEDLLVNPPSPLTHPAFAAGCHLAAESFLTYTDNDKEI